MPLIPALRRQRQVNLCEFKASLVYRASFRTARTVTTEKTCLEIPKLRTKPNQTFFPYYNSLQKHSCNFLVEKVALGGERWLGVENKGCFTGDLGS